jgi:transposase-like protein
MGEHRREETVDATFSTEFKRTTVQRIMTGEKTLAQLSRKLGISPTITSNWNARGAGAAMAVKVSDDAVSAAIYSRRFSL